MASADNAEEQLSSFLAKYAPEIGALAEALRNEMRRLYPTALELVYDNYNALAIGFSPTEKATDAIFSIALYPRWVSLFFLQAKGLRDPDRILKGKGTVAKHVVMCSPAMLHEPAVRDLMAEAVVHAKTPLDPKGTHRLVIKSVSDNQRSRRPGGANKTAARPVKTGKRPGRIERSPGR